MTTRTDVPVGTFPPDIEKAAKAAEANTNIVAKLTAILKQRVSIVCKIEDACVWNIKVRDKTGVYIAFGQLRQLPGCCGVCVSTQADVSIKYRSLGIGALLNSYRQELAWQLGYTTLLCTDVDKNVAEQRVLEKTGWKRLFGFKNRRTNNDVSMHVVNLREGRE